MNSAEFFESLEGDLAPFSDAEVDQISDATESDWRYRIELGALYVLSCILPVLPALLGLLSIRAYSLSGVPLLLGGAFMLGCVYAAVWLAKFIARPLVAWRYRASFLRQLAPHKIAHGL